MKRIRILLTALLLCSNGPFALAAGNQDEKAADSKAIGARIKQTLGAERYALVIGINDYDDPMIPDLKYAEADARAIYEILTNPEIGGIDPKKAELLLGKQATMQGIRKALRRLALTSKNAVVFIFYSGHGGKESDKGCWVPTDAQANDLLATSVTQVEIADFTSSIQSDRVIMLLDCCFAAATVQGQKALPDFRKISEGFTGRGRVTITASGSGEESIEAGDLKHGVFASHLLDAMQGKADGALGEPDGVITLPELTHYIDNTVADEARKRRGIQKPAVFMNEVQEPGKFLITINVANLEAAERRAQQQLEDVRKRVAALQEFLTRGEIDGGQFDLGKKLLETPPNKIKSSKADSRRLDAYLELIAGTLQPKHLAAALSVIDTAEQAADPPNAAANVRLGLQNRIDEMIKKGNFPGAESELAHYEKTFGQDKYSIDVRAQLKRVAVNNPPAPARPVVQPPPAEVRSVAKAKTNIIMGQVDAKSYKSYPGAQIPMYVVLQRQSNNGTLAVAGKKVNVWAVVEKGGQKTQMQSVITDANGRATFSVSVPTNARNHIFYVYREFEGDAELAPFTAKDMYIRIGSPPRTKTTRGSIRLPGGIRLP